MSLHKSTISAGGGVSRWLDDLGIMLNLSPTGVEFCWSAVDTMVLTRVVLTRLDGTAALTIIVSKAYYWKS